MQLDSLQQATQFSISPRLRAATPRKASSFARIQGRPGRIGSLRQGELLACLGPLPFRTSDSEPDQQWMSAAVDREPGASGGRLASLPCRYSIPRRPLPTTESRICARDVGSVNRFREANGRRVAAVVERVVPRGPGWLVCNRRLRATRRERQRATSRPRAIAAPAQAMSPVPGRSARWSHPGREQSARRRTKKP